MHHIDSKRSSPSLLARQLRLRLVAGDDSGVPRNLHNIVVSIHAIATFQALHDYLRPRVAGLLGSGSRLSGMLAALAASGLSGLAASESRQPTKSSEAVPTESSPATADASGSTSSITRRRSQRLSAKNAPAPDAVDTVPPPPQETPASETPVIEAPPPEAAPSDTVVESDLQADFTDEEIDAEVFDEGADPDTSISDKTVTLSIAEGTFLLQNNQETLDSSINTDGSNVEAQTPDGTRVATPNSQLKEGSSFPLRAQSARTSYAAALKTKPTDWHLEFSMDDNVLPLDLTIYGAIHQHEMRKQTGALPPSLVWQGMYTIKFKKVAGPLPSSEGESILGLR